MKNDKSRTYHRGATGALLTGLLLAGSTGQVLAADSGMTPKADRPESAQAEKTGTTAPYTVIKNGVTLIAPGKLRAAGGDTCYADHLCLFYNSKGPGANWVRKGNAAVAKDFSKVKFEGVGPGVGKPLKDHVRYVLNGDQNRTYGVFEKANYRGLRAWFSPNDARALPGLLHGKAGSGKFL
ncbi:peptidase inhibitor family I36 protein [Streptomyces sp. NPDC047049]|uniref:peptidase inhibitor family I36 protein n=1 Tax=Streptomyces sp. NPDC047049 TaxID=3156688 RepID=UPI0033CCEA2D